MAPEAKGSSEGFERDEAFSTPLFPLRRRTRRHWESRRKVLQSNGSLQDPLASSELLMAQALLGRTPFADAEQSLRAMAAEHPEMVRLRARAAQLCAWGGNRDEGIRVLAGILASNPEEPHVNRALADIYASAGDREAAWEHYRAGLDLGDLDASVGRNRLAACWVGTTTGHADDVDRLILRRARPMERTWLRLRLFELRHARQMNGIYPVLPFALFVLALIGAHLRSVPILALDMAALALLCMRAVPAVMPRTIGLRLAIMVLPLVCFAAATALLVAVAMR
jgi:tetratricopeptide (TPR) repeat protein